MTKMPKLEKNNWPGTSVKEDQFCITAKGENALFTEAQAAEVIRRVEAYNPWIPVSERLPEVPVGPPNASSEIFLLIYKTMPCLGRYNNFEGWRINGVRFHKRLNQKDITHWKPIVLPEQKELKDG